MNSLRRKPRILIHMDERRRDLVVSFALKHLLEQAGAKVFLSTRRTTLGYLRHLSFKAILIPSQDPIPDHLRAQIASRSKIYLFLTEGAWHGELALMVRCGGSYEPEQWEARIRQTDRIFLWGEYSRRILQDTGRFRKDQLVVVGAPRMDFFLAPSPPFQSGRCPIGVISNFILSNPYNEMGIFEIVNRWRNRHGLYYAPDRNVEDRFWIEAGWIRVWLEFLDECQRRGEKVQLRIHPRENIKSYDYLLKKYASVLTLADQEKPFEAWLSELDLLVGSNSTSFFEVVAAGKPGINLEGLLGDRFQEHTQQFPQNHYPIMNSIQTPRSWDELFNFIEQVRRGHWSEKTAYGEEARTLLKQVCGYPRSTSALANVVQTVMRDIEPGKEQVQTGSESLAKLYAKSVEWITFRLRRDPVISSWFPLDSSRVERQHAHEIQRYLQTAQQHPVQEQKLQPPAESLIPERAPSESVQIKV